VLEFHRLESQYADWRENYRQKAGMTGIGIFQRQWWRVRGGSRERYRPYPGAGHQDPYGVVLSVPADAWRKFANTIELARQTHGHGGVLPWPFFPTGPCRPMINIFDILQR
jgi:hypothetical protein